MKIIDIFAFCTGYYLKIGLGTVHKPVLLHVQPY